MTATRIQLNEFETPTIPDGYELYAVEVREARSRRQGRRFPVSVESPTEVIDEACEYILYELGWNRAVIIMGLQRDDGEEGRMVYDCDRDEWKVILPDEQISTAY
jgi:hypothetical protein